MSRQTLYDIADAREILTTWLDETEGELTPELETLLDELDATADQKIERVALFVREQLAEAKAIREEEDRLTARRKARERAAESLKTYLHAQMERLGKTKVTGLLATVAIQASPPSVKCALTQDQLRDSYRERDSYNEEDPYIERVPESYRLKSKAVLDAYKRGEWEWPDPPLLGVTVEQGTHLRIR
jgi:hypothetical protein